MNRPQNSAPRSRFSPSKQVEQLSSKQSHERIGALQLLVLLTGAILVARLFYLQVIRHSHYNELAVAEHQRKFIIPAQRGSLYFRDGDKIVAAVLNSNTYTLYADPKEVTKPDEVADVITSVFPQNRKDLIEKLKTPDTSYVVLQKRLSKAQVDRLFEKKESLIGVNVVAVPQRVYPEGSLGAQVLGFVNDEGTGQYGVEGYLDETLAGKAGLRSAITDVSGVPLTLDESNQIAEQPVEGQDTVLTIDRNIQAKAEEALSSGLKKFGATKGSVIVLDPNTGAVRAMANTPSYNPAKYYEVDTDAYERFRNKVVDGPYEPGSVMKPLVIAAGINEGVINRNSSYMDTGSVQIDDAVINDSVKFNQPRNMTDVLKYSLNTGVVWVLAQMGGGSVNMQGREKLYNYYTNHYGLAQLTGIEQAGELPGQLFKPTDQEGNNVRYANTVFGQGLNVSMIQVTSAFAAAVNDGNYYQPHVVEGRLLEDGKVESFEPKVVRQAVRPEVAKQIREMTNVALRESGAVVAVLVKPGYNVGGKSGTAQIIDPTTGKYSFSNAVGTYIGYGGDEKPKYVIMVRVDDAKLGSGDYAGGTVAAPIFAEISNWLIDYYNIKPVN